MEDLEPTTAEVLQVEEPAMPMTPVPVVIQGPARVQELPRKSAAGRTVPVGLNAVQLLPADPFRALLRIIAFGTAPAVLHIGFSEFAFSGDGAAVVTWPVGVPFEIRATQEVWVASPDGSVTSLSYYRENWAQG